jgi:hypothetical protein
VNIGITLAQYEGQIKKREHELREEFASTSRTDKDRIAALEKQLAAAEAQARSPERGLEKFKEVLASASRSLKQIGPQIPAEELTITRQALARGDSAEAERLFEKVLGQDKQRAPEVAYQLGQLAEIPRQPTEAAAYRLRHGRQVLRRSSQAAAGESGVPQCSRHDANTLGRYGDAEPLLERSLAIWKKTLGPEHPDVVTVLDNYAELLTQLKRDKEAAALRAQAKEIRARLASR